MLIEQIPAVVEQSRIHVPGHRVEAALPRRRIQGAGEEVRAPLRWQQGRNVAQPARPGEAGDPDHIGCEHVECRRSPVQIEGVELMLIVARCGERLFAHGNAGVAALELVQQRAHGNRIAEELAVGEHELDRRARCTPLTARGDDRRRTRTQQESPALGSLRHLRCSSGDGNGSSARHAWVVLAQIFKSWFVAAR